MNTPASRFGVGLAVFGAAAIAIATLTPSDAPRQGCLVCYDYATVDGILNVLLFIPLAVGLVMSGVRQRTAVLLLLGASVMIELLQAFVVTGRYASSLDVVANTVGAAIGAWIAARAAFVLYADRVRARFLLALWGLAWLSMQLVTAAALRTDPSTYAYYGQLARSIGGEPGYAGTVLRATVAGRLIPDWELGPEQSHEVREALRQDSGATIDVRVIAHEPNPLLSPILRIADEASQEIVLVAAAQQAVVFRVLTAADHLRLRPLRFRLTGALVSSGRVTDTVVISARQAGTEVVMTSSSPSGIRSARMRISGALGWHLLTGSDVLLPVPAGQTLLDAMWISLLVIPGGYLAFFASADTRRSRLTSVIGLAALVMTAFVMVAVAMGTSLPSAPELGAALAGAGAGWGVASVVRKNGARFGAKPWK